VPDFANLQATDKVHQKFPPLWSFLLLLCHCSLQKHEILLLLGLRVSSMEKHLTSIHEALGHTQHCRKEFSAFIIVLVIMEKSFYKRKVSFIKILSDQARGYRRKSIGKKKRTLTFSKSLGKSP
jgi:hypothetical protein